ncbi:MAG: hypothetical protein AAFR31_17715 [Cyanobacteria bacterium J06627_8]
MQPSPLQHTGASSTQTMAVSRLRDSLMLNSNQLESQLLVFVKWSLRQSLLPQFTPAARMKILERAWQAQKKAWEIRSTQMEVSTKPHIQAN